LTHVIGGDAAGVFDALTRAGAEPVPPPGYGMPRP